MHSNFGDTIGEKPTKEQFTWGGEFQAEAYTQEVAWYNLSINFSWFMLIAGIAGIIYGVKRLVDDISKIIVTTA